MFRRKPAFAGSFYTADADELKGEIIHYMHEADPAVEGDVVAIISPHAGYVYSGPVAAWSYKAVEAIRYDVVIVLAPSHHGHFDGFMVPESGVYETPLGTVKLDKQVCGILSKSNLHAYHPGIDESEHSLEVQVPFLQHALDEFTIVPVIIGTADFSACADIAQEITASIKDDTRSILLVISTDLSHYHPYNQAYAIDKIFIDTLKMFDEKELDKVLLSGDAEACGHGPLLCGMMVAKARGALRTQVYRYATSGDTAGDTSRVVGYVSAALVK